MENSSVTEQDILRNMELKAWGNFRLFFSWKSIAWYAWRNKSASSRVQL